MARSGLLILYESSIHRRLHKLSSISHPRIEWARSPYLSRTRSPWLRSVPVQAYGPSLTAEKVLPLKYDTKFDSEKTYLMIGCLGGLGRSMSKWMTKQGARKFVFLGRSGLDRTPARKLVDELESSGAAVKVVRGDVGVYEDVQRCVDVVEGPIGGVIQAAMGLNVMTPNHPYPNYDMRELTANRKHSGQPCPTNTGIQESTQRELEPGTSTMLFFPIPLPWTSF